jgi:hypothetical protein
MVVVDRPAAAARGVAAFHDQLASVGGGILAGPSPRSRRAAAGSSKRAAWVPDLDAVLQVTAPSDGWVVISRDGSALAGPDDRARPGRGNLGAPLGVERSVELARAEAAAVELERAAEAAGRQS